MPRTYRHDLHQVLKTVKPMIKHGEKWTSLRQSQQNERWGLCEFTWGTERKDLISSSSADRLPSSTRTRLFSYSSCVAMEKQPHIFAQEVLKVNTSKMFIPDKCLETVVQSKRRRKKKGLTHQSFLNPGLLSPVHKTWFRHAFEQK